MKLTIPELIDVNLPIEGVFHNLMIVSIKKSYPGQARKVMNAVWSLGQAMFTKCIVVVDEDVDAQDSRRCDAQGSESHRPGTRHSIHAWPSRLARSRLAASELRIEDGHRCHSQVEQRRVLRVLWSDEIVMDAKTKALVDGKWKALAKELGIG